MIKPFRVFLLIVTVLTVLAFVLPYEIVHAQTPAPTPSPEDGPADGSVPAGFRQIASALGVKLYQKDYANGSPDFVQVVDLSAGARVQLLHGQITEQRPAKGSYGGPDPRMTSLAIQTYWQNVSAKEPLAFCVINGGFFYMPEYPTRLAFPLKVDGEMITEGWGINTYVDQKLALALWPGQADIVKLTKENLYASDAPDILGGLTEEANKRAKYAVGRTFVGVDDRDGDHTFETILFFSTSTAKQTGAAAVLREFGADEVMMLDGGGSTQLLCKNGHYIRSDRPIPQALAIIAASPPEIAAEVVRKPDWQVLVEGERLPFELELRNTGTLTWTVDGGRFVIDPQSSGIPEWSPLEQPVRPGATAVLSDTLPAVRESGVHFYPVGWSINQGDRVYEGQAIEIPTVVLSGDLASRREELTVQIRQWSGRTPEQVQDLIEKWLAQVKPTESPKPQPDVTQAAPPIDLIRPQDIFWIPLLMLPILILLGLMIGRRTT